VKSESVIILIGTVHLDQEASSSLHLLLQSIKPACIAVEISAFSIRYRTRVQGAWLDRLAQVVQGLPVSKRRHLKIQLLERQLSMPFEWSTAKKYGEIGAIPVVPVDSGTISRRELPLWYVELLSEENLGFLVSDEDEPMESYFLGHYSKAERLLVHPERISEAYCQLVFDEKWCKREELLVRRITNLSRLFTPLVYIGGWMHLINTPSKVTLASRLGPDKVERYLVTKRQAVKI